MIFRVLERKEILEDPPVLLDVGASGSLHKKWKVIAPYSICIAFDADAREMKCSEGQAEGFKKLYVYPSVVSEQVARSSDFYLTKLPFCSSTLKPDSESLKKWAFAEFFEIDKVVQEKSVDLLSALNEISIKYIDWFKTDSQGTDLRLFKSLGDEKIKRVLMAEFEPGIIDAYVGEDKLFSLVSFMEDYPFWMTRMDIKGTQRISMSTLKKEFSGFEQKFLSSYLRESPCWGEVSYLNSFEGGDLTLREFLLGWVFATIEEQHGFAWELADKGYQKFNDAIFPLLKKDSLKRIRVNVWKIPFEITKRLLKKVSK